VVLHAEIASEKGVFDFEQVAHGIGEKMVRRHPHVFANEAVEDGKHSQRWTELKQKEKPKKSLFDGTPRSMPAMQLCQRYGEIAASVGFDWKDVKGVWKKLQEEMKELEKETKARKRNKKKLAEELGDVMFTLANLARHYGLSSEMVAREAAGKFSARFAKIEAQMRDEGKKLSKLSAKEWDTAWEDTKGRKK